VCISAFNHLGAQTIPRDLRKGFSRWPRGFDSRRIPFSGAPREKSHSAERYWITAYTCVVFEVTLVNPEG
jgi:hypothetical protein